MNMAQRKKVAATLSPSDWFNDFMEALAGILPNWSESYAIHKGDMKPLPFEPLQMIFARLWTGTT
jgi:hypothetical protein